MSDNFQLETEVEVEPEHPLDTRFKIINSIKSYENQLLTLVDGDELTDEGNHHIPELLEEQREDLRLSFYEEIRGLFMLSPTKGRLPARVYHEAVFLLISDRLNRNSGYYQALVDAREDVRKRNLDIGDSDALSLDMNSIQKLLSSLDEVDFVRNLGLSMGMEPDDLNKIVDFTIRREFASSKK